MKKIFTLAAAVLASFSLWAADITWDFSDRAAQSFENGKSYSFMATDGTTEMRYSAGSSDGIEAKSGDNSGYLKEGGKTGGATVKDIDGTTNVGKTRLVRLFVTGNGKLTINCTNNGAFKVLDGATNGTTLVASLAANTQSAEIAVANHLWIEATSKGYITSIVWSPAGTPVCPSNLTISGEQTYVEGETIELTATLEAGNGAISYQWYKGGIADENKIEGATAAKLEIANCAAANAGDYYCVASKADCAAAESAAYAVAVNAIQPTGTANITYVLSGSTVTGAATGVNSISGLSTAFELSNLTINDSKHLADHFDAIVGMNNETEPAEDKYVDVKFVVADGYVFTPSAVSVQAQSNNSTGGAKVVVKVMDAQTSVASSVLSVPKTSDGAAQFAADAFDGVQLEGTVHVRIYIYGAASDKQVYLKSPITVEGTVAVAPTKYNVTFAANGGTGEMATLKYAEGAEVKLPACTFTAPEGQEFDAWACADSTITLGKFIMPAKDVAINATWKTATVYHTVTYMNGEAELGTEQVADGEAVAKANEMAAKVQLATATWYNDAALTEPADLAAAITANKTLYAKFEDKYATSINIEKAVMENGKGYGIINQLGALGYASNITGSLDSLDSSKDLRNYAYLGLKVKQNGALLNFRLEAGKTVTIKFGEIKKTPNVSINGGEYANMTITNKVYTHTAEANELISIKMMDGNAVVFQQIMIGEDLQAPALFAINCAEAQNGSVAAPFTLGIPGEEITLTVTPAEGYKIENVTLNGETVEAVENAYSFTMPEKVANVAATFVKDTASALGNTEAEAKAVKVVRDGQLLILKNGVLYNAQGAIVK